MTSGYIARIVGALLLLVGSTSGGAGAAVIAVDGTACNLGNAILSANGDAAVGGCTTGAGTDTLVLGADAVLTSPVTASLEGGPSGLPAISSAIVITAGAGTVIERSNALTCVGPDPAAFRLLEVAAGGDLTLVGLTLRNGCVAAADIGAIASGGAVLVLAEGTLRIDDCALVGNTARGGPEGGSETAGAARGGAVASLGGSLDIVGSTFSGNEASGFDARGGAVAVEAGDLGSVTWSRFEGNRASPAPAGAFLSNPNSGGALSLRDADAGSLAHLVIAGNLAGREAASTGIGGPATGGGIALTDSRLRELRDALISANVARAGAGSSLLAADGLGGGLANSGFIDTIARTTFSANQALGYSGGTGRGGGLDNSGGIGRLVSTTLAENSAESFGPLHMGTHRSLGGGLANSGRIVEIAASTFVGNFVTSSFLGGESKGGGLYDDGTLFAAGGAAARDSLFAGNYASIGHECWTAGGFLSLGFNLQQVVDDFSCAFAAPGDLTNLDPVVLPLADHGCTTLLPNGTCLPTAALAEDSPALDAGLCSAAGTETDARGAVRPFDIAAVANAPGGDGCDIGAFERDGQLAAVHLGLSVADSIDPVASGSGAGNLLYSVALSSLGSATADGVVVAAPLSLPPGVSAVSVTASLGSWNGGTWTVGSLPSGATAELTFLLTVGFGTAGGTDMLSLSAAVTAATGHDGEFAADVERTSVVEGVFYGTFESGDTSLWSQTVGGS